MLNANFDENIKKGKKLNIFLSIIFMYNFTKFLVRCVVTNSKRMMTMSKEDVRGVAGLAFAIWAWTSGHLNFGLLAFGLVMGPSPDPPAIFLGLRLQFLRRVQAWAWLFEKGLENSSFFEVKSRGPSRLGLELVWRSWAQARLKLNFQGWIF